MFRFAEAQVLHDETSWSARGTRRRRPARPSSGSQICRMQSAPEALVYSPLTSSDAARLPARHLRTARHAKRPLLDIRSRRAAQGEPQQNQQLQAHRGAPQGAPHRQTHALNSSARTPAAALPKNAQNRPQE